MLSKKKVILLILPFCLFIGSLTAELILFFNTTSRVEAIQFPSLLDESQNVVEITSGNLFYPRNYDPTHQYPVVVIVHGFEVTKTTDLRLATELAKHGIFALPIDLSGHGHTTGTLGPYFWRHSIGALDYIYSRPDLFNFSAVGMCGHSLGGWTTFLAMGYEAGHLNRINASVTWAGIFNTSTMLEASQQGDVSFNYILRNLKVDSSLFDNLSYQFDHNPINYYNGSLGAQPAPHPLYGPRMLIIHGTNDDTVPYSNLLDANTTLSTNATYYTVEGGDHLLINDEVVRQTILHFEHHFFGIDPLDNDLKLSDFTYLDYYILFLLTLLGLFFSILSLTFLFWYKHIFRSTEPTITKPRGFRFVFLISLPYFGLIYAIYSIQQLIANLYLSLLIGSGFLLLYTLGILGYLRHTSDQKRSIKTIIRENYQSGSLLLGFHLGIIAIGTYIALAFNFGILLFSPLSIEYLFLSLIGLYPFVLSHELFLRKLIQDNLPLRPLKNRWIKRILLGFITLIFMIFFVYLLNFMFLAVLAMLVGFAAATLSCIFIYDKYPSLGATTLFITIIMASFAANCYFFFL
ncbi:MAG: alpha/beta hydrolase family protein [Candidatus Helarchaeota archaeon]